MSMTRQLASNLIRLAEIYRGRFPQSLVTISKLVARDSGLLTRITNTAAGFTVGKYDETVQRFSDYWPDDLVWPTEIPRPKPLEKRAQRRRSSVADWAK